MTHFSDRSDRSKRHTNVCCKSSSLKCLHIIIATKVRTQNQVEHCRFVTGDEQLVMVLFGLDVEVEAEDAFSNGDCSEERQ